MSKARLIRDLELDQRWKTNYLASWADRHSTLFLQKFYLACITSFFQWPHHTKSRLCLNYKKKSRICPRFVAEMTRRRIHYCWRFCVNEKKRWNEMDRLKLQGKTRLDGLRLEWKSCKREREREYRRLTTKYKKVSNHSRFNWVGAHSRKGSGKFKFFNTTKVV